jgi:hypothetical protein
VIWDVTGLGTPTLKSYLVFKDGAMLGRGDGVKAWAEAMKVAEKFGAGHAIWRRAQDGTEHLIEPWPRRRD